MAKITNDKYYTLIDLANYCWDKVLEVIGEENISEIIEPSCGNGAFYHHKDMCPHFGYDIEPEYDARYMVNITKGDYLKQDIKYLWGRLIIGNPPYGRCLNMAQKFYKKSIEIADYIAFILPISQLNNANSLYEFDLIYSEDLGIKCYTDRDLHCCFNIYRRPKNGKFNKRPSPKLKDITIYRQDKKDYELLDYDIRMCYWGDGTAGKILANDEHYSGEYKIKVNNDELKDEIINFIKSFDWNAYVKGIAMKRLKQYHIVDVLKNAIPNIE